MDTVKIGQLICGLRKEKRSAAVLKRQFQTAVSFIQENPAPAV